MDLTPPKEEKYSTDHEDESKNQKLKFFVKKSQVTSKKNLKGNDQIQEIPIIKD